MMKMEAKIRSKGFQLKLTQSPKNSIKEEGEEMVETSSHQMKRIAQMKDQKIMFETLDK